MALLVWLCVIWVAAASVVILLFIGARLSPRVRGWLFGPVPSAALHHLAAPRAVPASDPPSRQAA